jgi:hypothetical protein
MRGWHAWVDTHEALRRARRTPCARLRRCNDGVCSIIIVGVGSNDFDRMDILDGNGAADDGGSGGGDGTEIVHVCWWWWW